MASSSAMSGAHLWSRRPALRWPTKPRAEGIAMTTETRELPSRFALPLLGDTLSFASDPAGFLSKRAHELGPVFEVSLFGRPTACFVGPEAFALLLDENN